MAITGATGFVGKAALDVALSKGHKVRALTRRKQHDRKCVEWIDGGLSDPSALRDLVRGCDCVIHIAGLTNTLDPTEFQAANVEGTKQLIDACQTEGVSRFVFVSSLSAREPDLSAYGASKAEAEKCVVASPLDWTIVRPPAVYGPHDKDMFELFRAAKYGVVPVPAKGRTSIIHVEDLARLLIALIPSSHLVSGKTFEPWDDNAYGYEHKELAKMIGEAMGNAHAIAAPLPPAIMELGAKIDKAVRGHKAKLTDDRVSYMVHPDWVSDLRKAPPLSLWQAVWDGPAGLKQTAEWYKAEGWL